MPNEKNLIPNNKRTPSERRENARKAGKKSGEVRRKKRQLKDDMITLLKLPVADTRKWNKLARMGVDMDKIDNNMLLTVALFLEASDGDVSAFKEIRDLIGEKNETDDSSGTLADIIKAVENIE